MHYGRLIKNTEIIMVLISAYGAFLVFPTISVTMLTCNEHKYIPLGICHGRSIQPARYINFEYKRRYSTRTFIDPGIGIENVRKLQALHA